MSVPSALLAALVAVLSAAGLSACRDQGLSGTDAGNANTVAGILVDAGGKPVPNATVYLRTVDYRPAVTEGAASLPAEGSEWSSRTDTEGRYAFRLGPGDTGQLVLEAVTEGFGGRRSEILRKAGEPLDLGPVPLAPLGEVAGTARLPAGHVGDLLVTLPGTRNAAYLAPGEEDFSFANLPPGEYRALVQGLRPVRKPVEFPFSLDSGESRVLSLVAGDPEADAAGAVAVRLALPGISRGTLQARLSGLDTVATADSSGSLVFRNVPPGSYRLSAWGVSPARDTVRLDSVTVAPGRLAGPLPLAFRIRALIVDGIANHDWVRMTRYNRAILEQSGLFEVAVSTTPPDQSTQSAWAAWQPRFADHDVVILHCNSGRGDDGKANPWPAARQRELEDFVAGGGGLVNTQATFPAFYGWPAFEAMHGLLWRDLEFQGPSYRLDSLDSLVPNPAALNLTSVERVAGDTGTLIGTAHAGHPVNRGAPPQWRYAPAKLVYRLKGSPEGVTVLAYSVDPVTGSREPQQWAKTYGRGRAFTTVLGDLAVGAAKTPLLCAGYQTFLVRGAEWAATAQVTFPIPGDFPGTGGTSLRNNLKD